MENITITENRKAFDRFRFISLITESKYHDKDLELTVTHDEKIELLMKEDTRFIDERIAVLLCEKIEAYLDYTESEQNKYAENRCTTDGFVSIEEFQMVLQSYNNIFPEKRVINPKPPASNNFPEIAAKVAGRLASADKFPMDPKLFYVGHLIDLIKINTSVFNASQKGVVFRSPNNLKFTTKVVKDIPQFHLFQCGGVRGLFCGTKETFIIIAAQNTEEKNTDFNDVMAWFSWGCEQANRSLTFIDLAKYPKFYDRLFKEGFTKSLRYSKTDNAGRFWGDALTKTRPNYHRSLWSNRLYFENANPPMPERAISIKNPFATLMMHGKIETRSWDTDVRGWVLLCASKKPCNKEEVFAHCGMKHFQHVSEVIDDENEPIPDGHAFAIAFLAKTWPMRKSDADYCMVQWKDGLYCHQYTRIHPIKPFEFKGAQRWKMLDKETFDKIEML